MLAALNPVEVHKDSSCLWIEELAALLLRRWRASSASLQLADQRLGVLSCGGPAPFNAICFCFLGISSAFFSSEASTNNLISREYQPLIPRFWAFMSLRAFVGAFIFKFQLIEPDWAEINPRHVGTCGFWLDPPLAGCWQYFFSSKTIRNAAPTLLCQLLPDVAVDEQRFHLLLPSFMISWFKGLVYTS